MGYPLVSLCIPVYNRADIVADTIRSAIAQTYEKLEILVVDNASTDNLREVVSQFSDKRIQYFRNPENLGQFGNFNRCIDLSHGEYIHILHSDDIIPPDFTKTCIQFLESHPNVVLTCTSAKIITSASERIKKFFTHDKIFTAPKGFIVLLTDNFIFCPSVICRRDVFDSVGKFSLDYPYAGDYNQWLRIAKDHDIAYISDSYIYYRTGEHSETHNLTAFSMRGYEEVLEIITKIADECSEKSQDFRKELNQAFFTFLKNLQYARIVKWMRREPFDCKAGKKLQLLALSMIKPQTLREKVRYYSCYSGLFIPVIPWIGLLFRGVNKLL